MGRVQRQSFLIGLHRRIQILEMLFGNLAKSKLQLSRAGIVIGQLELACDDLAQLLPALGGPIQAVQRAQRLQVILGRLQDVLVQFNRLVRIVHLLFVERREL